MRRVNGSALLTGGSLRCWLLFCALGFASPLLGLSSTWAAAGGGTWSDGGNWSAGAPVSAGDTAIFGTSVAIGTHVISEATPITIGTINLASGSAGKNYNISAPLTYDGSGSDAAINITTVPNGTMHNLSGNSTLTSNLVVTNTTTLTTTISGALSGSGSFTRAGSSTGSITLTGANTYTGGTTISGGSLAISGAGSLSSTGTVNLSSSTATLNVSGVTTSTTIGALSGVASSTLAVGTKTLTLGNASSTLFAGNITGTTGTITKVGAGSLTLTGSTAFTGTWAINEGALILSSALSVAGTPDFTIGSSGTLGVTVDINANVPITLASGSTIDVSGTAVFEPDTVGGVGGSLTKTGTGTLELSDTLSYTGATEINAGTLALSGNGFDSIDSSSAVNLNAATSVLDISAEVVQTCTIQAFSGVASSSVLLGSNTLLFGTASSTSFGGVISGANIQKQGAGTVAFTGVNTFTGTTRIDAGTLQLSGAGSISTSSGVNVNDASATFDISALSGSGTTIQSLTGVASSSVTLGSKSLTCGTAGNFTFPGVISGVGGSLTKQGAGIFTLTGSNTYTGGSTVTAGTLRMGIANALSSTGPVTVSSGTFDLNSFNQTIGNLSGAGVVTFGAGSTLTITQASEQTYSGTFGSAGDIVKNGSSTLHLTGTSASFNGTCTINTGEINLNGTLGAFPNGHMTVASGGTFSGNATLGGTLTNSGTLNVGNSIGIMNVSVLLLNNSSIFNAEINDALQSDLIFVSPGTATIDGTLNVSFLPGVYVPGLTYTIVNAPTGGVLGTFDPPIIDNSVDFEVEVLYGPTTVMLTIIESGSSLFLGIPFSGNAAAVADNLTAINEAGALATDPDLLNAVSALVGQSASAINQALVRLDPTPYTAIGGAAALNSPYLAEFFAGKKRKSCCPSRYGCERGKWSLWADPLIMHFNQHSIGSQDGFHATATGFAIGTEKGLPCSDWKVGGGAVYEHLLVDWASRRGHSHSNNLYGALFADRETKQTHFAIALLGGWNSIAAARKIQYTTIDQQASADYSAGELIAQASGALYAGAPTEQVQFYATLTSDTLFQPSFTEQGAGGLNLNVRSQTSSALVSEAGVLFKLRREFAGGCWGPDFWAAYVNETFFTDGHITSNFVNQVIPFTTIGVRKTQNLAELGVTLSGIINDHLTLAATYSPQFGAYLIAHRADLRFRWMF